MYPHTLTGILASQSKSTIRKNAALLPAYTLLLGLIALLGYMGHAAHLKIASPTDVVPRCSSSVPGWFAGFAFAAIGIGALVPAAVMSIGAANLFTRNVWKPMSIPPWTRPASPRRQNHVVGGEVRRVAVIVFLPTQFALDLQFSAALDPANAAGAGLRPVLQLVPRRRCCWAARRLRGRHGLA